jgi:hypothetical protein
MIPQIFQISFPNLDGNSTLKVDESAGLLGQLYATADAEKRKSPWLTHFRAGAAPTASLTVCLTVSSNKVSIVSVSAMASSTSRSAFRHLSLFLLLCLAAKVSGATKKQALTVMKVLSFRVRFMLMLLNATTGVDTHNGVYWLWIPIPNVCLGQTSVSF